MLYIVVANADDAAKRAAELGGTVLKGAFDVLDAGRMAVLQDPTGAVFCVWQPGRTRDGHCASGWYAVLGRPEHA